MTDRLAGGLLIRCEDSVTGAIIRVIKGQNCHKLVVFGSDSELPADRVHADAGQLRRRVVNGHLSCEGGAISQSLPVCPAALCIHVIFRGQGHLNLCHGPFGQGLALGICAGPGEIDRLGHPLPGAGCTVIKACPHGAQLPLLVNLSRFHIADLHFGIGSIANGADEVLAQGVSVLVIQRSAFRQVIFSIPQESFRITTPVVLAPGACGGAGDIIAGNPAHVGPSHIQSRVVFKP